MTEAALPEAVLTESDLKHLDDQLWRRLGITQTFERLLVETVAVAPGAIGDVRDFAGRSLSGGAAKFWDMSFPQTMRDLCKRNILEKQDETLALNTEFADRVQKLVSGIRSGQSHVAPTPGVTLEAIQQRAKEREERLAAEKAASRRRSASTTRTRKKPTKAEAAPLKRSAPPEEAASVVEEVVAPRPAAPAPPTTPPRELFTSMRLNRLLDALDNDKALATDKLGERLGLRGGDLSRFLETTEAMGLTRRQAHTIALHWEGQKLARTSDIDRRMALRDAVAQLRDKAEEAVSG